jgi:release factor glutamine methyltransferase
MGYLAATGHYASQAQALESGDEFQGNSEQILGDQLLAWRRGLLAEGGRAADLDWLLDLGGGLSWQALQALRLHPERVVTLRWGRSRLETLWHRHLQGSEPLQYLVGRCPWRDLELIVAPGVLIPRQETEQLVDLALALRATQAASASPPLWADLGTGSGCLAIALGQALPGSRGFAVEASAQAEQLARLNLGQAGLLERVSLLAGDWWQPLEPWWGHLDLVVTNPPYIPSSTMAELDPVVRDHEPSQALDGGADGLTAIRAIVAGAEAALARGGVLVLEHHHDQSGRVLELLHRAGLDRVRAHRDLEGVCRFASARRRSDPSP